MVDCGALRSFFILEHQKLAGIQGGFMLFRMRTVQVPLDDRSYPIFIGSNLASAIGKQASKLSLGQRCAVVSDSNVAPIYAAGLSKSLENEGFKTELIVVPAGESSKSLKTVQICYDRLAAMRLERKSFIVALGGGVVGDLAGFLAATYMRGIDFVQVPTSLLAQVDSSVGGKVGVNLKAGKNLVGAFYQPRFVVCDLESLSTLPEREFKSGLAEVIKYGIIYDAGLFRRLERDMSKILARDTGVLAAIIARCCEIKAEVVQQDETEGGLRAILNFGHTVGHAIESVAGYGKYLHGEAVAIGSVAAAHLSCRVLGMPTKDALRMLDLFEQAGLPTGIELSRKQQDAIMEAMLLDKKASGGEVKFVLAQAIGKVEFGQKVDTALVREAVSALSKTQ